MEKADQQKYMLWIEKILVLDQRLTKDERLYYRYYDMNNHPRFSCKHFKKHRDENALHRCTLCIATHAPFQCPRTQINGGCAKPNWACLEFTLAKEESRSPDFRWGQEQPPPPPRPAGNPSQEAHQQQVPAADPQPMCAATAMMHGIPMAPSSSRQSAACPSIHEHRPWAPPVAEEVQLPQPGYEFQLISGILTLLIAPMLQDRWRRSCDTSPQCRAQRTQATLPMAQLQQTTFEIFEGKHHLRILQPSSATLRSSSLKQILSEYGIMAFKMRLWMKLKRSIFT